MVVWALSVGGDGGNELAGGGGSNGCSGILLLRLGFPYIVNTFCLKMFGVKPLLN